MAESDHVGPRRALRISTRVIGPRMNDIAHRGCRNTVPPPSRLCASSTRARSASVCNLPKHHNPALLNAR